jgi:hypothetical protein
MFLRGELTKIKIDKDTELIGSLYSMVFIKT